MPLNPKGLSRGLVDRIKSLVSREMGGEEGKGEPGAEGVSADPLLTGAMSDTAVLLYRIRHGARSRTLLWMKYNNTWRHVEPYSFRYRSKGMQPLFFGWCQLHDEIHSFRLDRVQDIQVTDRPFAPRVEVEIA